MSVKPLAEELKMKGLSGSQSENDENMKEPKELEQNDELVETKQFLTQALFEWDTERWLCENKTHNTGLTMRDPEIIVPKEAWNS